jgi:hypothetical protein
MTPTQQKGLTFKTAQWNKTANVGLTEEEYLAMRTGELLDIMAGEYTNWRTQEGLKAFAAQPDQVQDKIMQQLGVPEMPAARVEAE